MKILFVYQFCTLGGVETVLRNRLPEFHRHGIYPKVVFLNDLGGSRIFEGFENVRCGCPESDLPKIIKEGEFDFVIPIDTPQLYPLLKKSDFRGTLVTEVHTNNLDILRYLSSIGETNTRAIITPSLFEKELIFREIRGFEKTGIPVYVVPNPVSLEVFQFRKPKNRPDKKVIGWVGRLEKEKNWKGFLEIASAILKKRSDLLFLLIGGYSADGAVKKEFLAMVKGLNLIDHLKWISYLQYDRMPGAYSLFGASGGCLVTTSVIEPFGMTVIEAMACQCPVAASRVGGFQEVIEEGRNGLLFEVNHTEEALRKIEMLMDDPSERESLVRNGSLTVRETYSPERVVSKYLKTLQEVAEKLPGSSHHEAGEATSLGRQSEGSPFERAVSRLFESGKSSSMHEPYVRYALSTNDRGKALAKQLSHYLKFRNRSYLDIGTAYGGYLVAFSKRGCRPCLGIEIDGKLVELCKLNLVENNLASDCVLHFDICNPFPDALREREFDIITCADVLEHVMDIPRALENVKSLMADKGYLYLELPNRYHVKNVLGDPHFGLFGITLLNRADAREYFGGARTGDYSVAEYYAIDYLLSFFPQDFFHIEGIWPDTVDFRALDTLFRTEIEMAYESKIRGLSISSEVKNRLKEALLGYINKYIQQLAKREIVPFYIQNWKIIIQKK